MSLSRRGKTLSALAVLLGNTAIVEAQPVVTGSSGTWSHQSAVTISGTGFGTKTTAAPVVWDDASGASIGSKWSGAWPSCATSPLAYRTPAQVGRGIPLPHNNITKYISGAHAGSSGPQCGYNVILFKTRTVSLPAYTYATWYERVDDNWTFGADDNFKTFAYSVGTTPYELPNNWYLEYNPRPTSSTSGAVYHINDDGASLQTPDLNGHNWWWDAAVNPMSGVWKKIEMELRYTNATDGYIKLWENGTLKVNYRGRTDNLAGTTRTEGIGGYARNYGIAGNWRYFADVYLDYSRARVILGNAPTLAASTQREVQIPSSWASSSITVSANLATFSSGQTAYVYVFDGSGISNSAGLPITIGAGGPPPPPPPPSTGQLVAAYAFSENTGSAVTDASGSGNNGTISGAAWTASGKYGTGLSFNGTNAWVTTNNATSLALAEGMTLEAWVYPTALSGWRTVLMKETNGGLAYALYAHDNSPWPATYVRIAGATISDGAGAITALPLNTWTHLASTYNGSALTIYVNGTAVSSQPVTGAVTASTGPLRIGGNDSWGEYFRGVIDEVRIYSRALSATEIQADMDTPVVAPDTTPPSVTAATPAAGATGVSSTTTVTATFSEELDATSVTATSFELRNAAGSLVPASVGYSAGPRVATLTPSSALTFSTTYTATVKGTPGGVRDAAANVMAANYTWSFTTAAPPDTTPPTVSSVSPTNGATGASVASLAVVTFSEAMNAGTISTSTIELRNVSNELVASTLHFNSGTHTATLTPSSALSNGTVYTIAVKAGASGVKDAAGNALAAAFTSSFTTVAAPPTEGLVAAYSFNENGGTAAYDDSGNNHVGAIAGAAWTVGRFGSGLEFNGTTNWITVPHAASLSPKDAITVEAWVYPRALSGWNTVVLKERSTGLAYALYANDNSPKPAAYVRLAGASGSEGASGPSALALNTWTHLAMTFDGATLKLVVNGAYVYSQPAFGSMAGSAGPLRIGGNALWGEYFTGVIDEVRIYNRALSLTEIQADMVTAIGGNPGDLVALFTRGGGSRQSGGAPARTRIAPALTRR